MLTPFRKKALPIRAASARVAPLHCSILWPLQCYTGVFKETEHIVWDVADNSG